MSPSDMDDTTTTRIVKLARTNWKAVSSVGGSLALAIITASVAFGRHQGDLSNLAASFNALGPKVDGLSSQVAEMSRQQAATLALLSELQSQVHEQREKWDRVEDVAELPVKPRRGPRR